MERVIIWINITGNSFPLQFCKLCLTAESKEYISEVVVNVYRGTETSIWQGNESERTWVMLRLLHCIWSAKMLILVDYDNLRMYVVFPRTITRKNIERSILKNTTDKLKWNLCSSNPE